MTYTPHTWVNNHVPAINETHLNEMEAGISGAHTLSVPAARTYYVSPDFTVDTDHHRYKKIQDAIDQAIIDVASISDASKQVLIMVYPGTYTEQIHSVDGIHIVGVQAQDNRYSKGAILTNAGTAEENYPIRSEIGDEYRIFGMNIETTNGNGIIGKIPKLGIFGSCFFNGKWIENNLDTSHYVLFDDCDLRDKGWVVFDFTGTNLLGSRLVSLLHCTLFDCAPSLLSTHIGTATVSFLDNTVFTQSAFRLVGDWNLTAQHSHIANGRETARGRSRIGGTGDINITYCIMSSGLRFTSNPNSIFMGANTFRNGHETIPVGEPDITADVDITTVNYFGNIQFNGICGCIHITNPEKHVGGNRKDMYFSLQHAIDSIATGEGATVRIWEDLTGLPEMTLPNANVNIKIKGQKAYSLSFTGNIVEIGNDRTLGFNDIVTLSGGNIELNGTNNELGFESCQYVNGHIILTSGTFAIIYKSSVFGSTGNPAVSINNTGTTFVIGYSRAQGAAGSPGTPAIMFNAVADDKLKMKFSTAIHGDKTTLAPIQTTVGKVYVAIYNSGGNSDLVPPATISNRISSAGNVADDQITF